MGLTELFSKRSKPLDKPVHVPITKYVLLWDKYIDSVHMLEAMDFEGFKTLIRSLT
jgi:hypothetical protein